MKLNKERLFLPMRSVCTRSARASYAYSPTFFLKKASAAAQSFSMIPGLSSNHSLTSMLYFSAAALALSATSGDVMRLDSA